MGVPKQPVLGRLDLQGELVRLRPLTPDDADVAFPLIYRRRPILDWLVWQGPTGLDDLRERFATWRARLETGRSYRLAIEDPAGEFVGSIGLRCFERLFQVELGYWLAEAAWGKGYATEAIRLADHVAFRHLDATVVTAEVFVGNHASCRVLERNGFRRERTLRRVPEIPPDVPGHERWIYTLTRGDYVAKHGDFRPLREEIERFP